MSIKRNAIAPLLTGLLLFPQLLPAMEASDLCPSPPLQLKEGTLTVNGTSVSFAICIPPVPDPANPGDPGSPGRVFYFSHGTVTDPEDIAGQLIIDAVPLPALFAQQVGAFAWLNRSDLGFSDINVAKEELRTLRTLVEEGAGQEGPLFPGARSYLIGISQGANFVTHLVESDWPDFDGAGAVCGPIGNFWKQLQYQGDVFNLVDHYLGVSICEQIDSCGSCPIAGGRPRLLRPDPNTPPWLKVVQIPAPVLSCADEVDAAIKSILTNPDSFQTQAIENLLAVARLDRNQVYAVDPTLVADELGGIVEESIRNHADAVGTLGGPFYRNQFRVYRGSDNDAALNADIQRFNPFALRAFVEVKENYETSGELLRPLVAPHNGSILTIKGQDPRVPFWHELLYKTKALLNGSGSNHTIVPLGRYGHCNITLAEAQTAVGALVCEVEPGLPICP